MDPFQRRHPPAFLLQGFQGILVGLGLLLLVAGTCGVSLQAATTDSNLPFDPYADWDASLTPVASVPFAPIDPFEATYRFGWQGVSAGGATVSVSISEDSSGKQDPANHSRRRIVASGGPNEWVRKLWNYHVNYQGEAGINGQVPSWFHMDESLAKRMMVSDALFTPGAVFASHRFITESQPWLYTPLPGIRDLFAAMLFVRSQPLNTKDHLRLTTFPDRNPYLVDLTVAGHDTINIMGREVKAIRFDLLIQTIETMGPNIGRLAPHKKFRSGRVWMSDDSRRLPLKAEVDVFIGSVFAELVKITPPL